MGDSVMGAVVEDLAKLLHESGRAAVERGMVFMKGPDITPRPFAEWADLPEDAKIGRRMMADYVIEHAREAVELLEKTLPVEEALPVGTPAVEGGPVDGGSGHVAGSV